MAEKTVRPDLQLRQAVIGVSGGLRGVLFVDRELVIRAGQGEMRDRVEVGVRAARRKRAKVRDTVRISDADRLTQIVCELPVVRERVGVRGRGLAARLTREPVLIGGT